MTFHIRIDFPRMPLKIYIINKNIWNTMERFRLTRYLSGDVREVLIERNDVDISLSSFNFEAKDITAEDLLDLEKTKAKITKQILDILEPKIEAKGYYVESTSLDVGQLTIYVRQIKVEAKEEVKQEAKEEVNANAEKLQEIVRVIFIINIGLIFLICLIKL